MGGEIRRLLLKRVGHAPTGRIWARAQRSDAVPGRHVRGGLVWIGNDVAQITSTGRCPRQDDRLFPEPRGYNVRAYLLTCDAQRQGLANQNVSLVITLSPGAGLCPVSERLTWFPIGVIMCRRNR